MRLMATFLNMRSRLQRLKDAKFFSGWVLELSDTTLLLKITGAGQLSPGDTCMIEVFGAEEVASIKATMVSIVERKAEFQIVEAIRYRPNSENARVSVSNVAGTVVFDGVESEVTVLDVSATGAGLLTGRTLPRKSDVKLVLHTSVGEIACSGEVRYCRPDADAMGSYRVGVLIDGLGRLEKARWHRLLECEAA